MSARDRLLCFLAAGFTGASLGLIAFLLVGLISERLPAAWQRGMYGRFIPVTLGICGAVFLAGFALAWRRTAMQSQANAVKWFFGGVGCSAAAFAVGAIAFMAAHQVLPRRWFSRGGDWDFDPLYEATMFGLACALAGFWLVYRRAFSRRSDDHETG